MSPLVRAATLASLAMAASGLAAALAFEPAPNPFVKSPDSGPVSRQEFQYLRQRVDTLERRVEWLEKKQPAPGLQPLKNMQQN